MRRSALLILVMLISFAVPGALAQDIAEPVTHVIQPGDTLYRIALRYGVPMDSIASANGITDYSRILTGQSLVIPGLNVPDSSADVVNPLIAGTPIVHEVQFGETLEALATRYETTVDQILKSNNLENANYISAGVKLNIWTTVSAETETATVESSEPAAPAVEAQPVTHTVQRGEILAAIARKYEVTVNDIIRANNITNPDLIFSGQKLVIPGVSAEIAAQQQTENIAAQQSINGERPLVTPPTPTITTGKIIMVDLSDSMTYAYQDGVLVYSALSSMGLPATPTVVGQFKIYNRLPSQTMSGPGYYLPGVQYVQYFYQGYALHGAYWHNNFGQPMSHGCVNLRDDDAQWLYNFAELGTPVHVQY